MASEGPQIAACGRTGLSVPECSCRSCLEAMLAGFGPGDLGATPGAVIRITRTADEPEGTSSSAPRDGRD